MLSIIHVYILITALITTTIIVPFVSQLSLRFGGLDAPGGRKIHSKATPRLGGIAIFCSLLLTVIFFCEIDKQIKGFLAGAIVIFLTGLADDLGNLTPRQKFVGEFLAASLAIFLGDICVRNLGNPFGFGIIELGPLAIPFTILGIVGLINAINLLDGLDGLAAGVCALACISFAVISYSSGNTVLFSLVIALLGTLLGFLRYNNYPAIIFMGDCGSLLLGYSMGVFSVLLATGGKEAVSPYIPLIILGIPILDTLVVMLNRFRTGKRLFQPDQTHFHHRLLDLGIGHRYTVVIVFGLSYLLSLVAIFGHDLSDTYLLGILLTLAAVVCGVMHWLVSRETNITLMSDSNKSLRFSKSYRSLVRLSRYLVIVIKYLLIAILLLPVFLSHHNIISFTVSLIVLLFVSVCVYLSRCSWGGMLLPGYIYAFGFLLVFALENYGRDELLFGVSLITISNVLFLLLLICEALKSIFRKWTSRLIVSPFEYLVVLIVLSMPLMPESFTANYYLMIVAVKALILFIGFKLVLMRQVRRNRKIILALVVAIIFLISHNLLGI